VVATSCCHEISKPLFWLGTYPFFDDVFVQIVSAITSFGAYFQERKRLDLYNTEFRNKNCYRKHCVLCFHFEFVCCFCLNKLPAMHVVNWLSEHVSNALYLIRGSCIMFYKKSALTEFVIFILNTTNNLMQLYSPFFQEFKNKNNFWELCVLCPYFMC